MYAVHAYNYLVYILCTHRYMYTVTGPIDHKTVVSLFPVK